ncbi:MAG: GNAT family N-acetyltransferase [Chloroflexi bacterium]|nr:GNAT family N-acetyltransferase [Chloroflexota bacterium]
MRRLYIPERKGARNFMIETAKTEDGDPIKDITAKAGVFSQEEVDCVRDIWEEYLSFGADSTGYHFIVERQEGRVSGFACYGYRDLTDGVYDLFWIAVDPGFRRDGVGRRLLTACEDIVRTLGGRMIIAETSGKPLYEATRAFYLGTGYKAEAVIKDFYSAGDDLVIFVKRL